MEGSLEEKPAGESGDEGKIERSHSINLNSLPAITAEAAATRENGDLQGAAESGGKGSSTGKLEESSCIDQKKLPKNEEVDEGIGGVGNLKLICGTVLAEWKDGEGKESKTATWGSLELKTTSDSSHYNGETEAAKQDLYTANILKITNDSTVSSQTESDAVKTEASISLGLETKSDPGNNQGGTEANKLDLNNTENLLNSSEPAVSDHREIDKVFKANVLDREENPEVEHEESPKTSLLGSLKSFAYGIRNFWKKL